MLSMLPFLNIIVLVISSLHICEYVMVDATETPLKESSGIWDDDVVTPECCNMSCSRATKWLCRPLLVYEYLDLDVLHRPGICLVFNGMW